MAVYRQALIIGLDWIGSNWIGRLGWVGSGWVEILNGGRYNVYASRLSYQVVHDLKSSDCGI
jgi:hypothetical protein